MRIAILFAAVMHIGCFGVPGAVAGSFLFGGGDASSPPKPAEAKPADSGPCRSHCAAKVCPGGDPPCYCNLCHGFCPLAEESTEPDQSKDE